MLAAGCAAGQSAGRRCRCRTPENRADLERDRLRAEFIAGMDHSTDSGFCGMSFDIQRGRHSGKIANDFRLLQETLPQRSRGFINMTIQRAVLVLAILSCAAPAFGADANAGKNFFRAAMRAVPQRRAE